MNKFICTQCASECIVHTMDGKPNFCLYNVNNTPYWKDITEGLQDGHIQDVAVWDKKYKKYSYVYDINEDCVARITEVNASSLALQYLSASTWNVERGVNYCDEMLYPIEIIPFNNLQMISLVGKIIMTSRDKRLDYRLVTGASDHILDEDNCIEFHVMIDGEFYSSHDLIVWYLDGKPCFNFRYKVSSNETMYYDGLNKEFIKEDGING